MVAAYVGTLISYAIVVVKSLGQPALNQAWLQRALKDENVQYALLALYWAISKPVYSESPIDERSEDQGASQARRSGARRAKREGVADKKSSDEARIGGEETRRRRRTADHQSSEARRRPQARSRAKRR